MDYGSGHLAGTPYSLKKHFPSSQMCISSKYQRGVSVSTCVKHPPPYCLFYVVVTPSRLVWEEGALVEEWPCQTALWVRLWGVFLIDD